MSRSEAIRAALAHTVRMSGTSKPPAAFPLTGGPSSVSTERARRDSNP